ncbi:MAG: hypothetical protein O2960_27100 [Verrucomicrobia bacterium]|nr:hypothetical protein [Verrucomicrobiota bacterium]
MKLNANGARSVLVATLLIQLTGRAIAQPLPEFDFTQTATAREWEQPHHISALRPTDAGLEITINGNDPYFFGPAREYPENTPLWLVVRLKSDQAGTGEVFYFRDRAEAGKSVQFSVKRGEWVEARLRLPALGANYRLRLDPPGTDGKVLLADIRFETRVNLPPPSWPEWTSPGPVTGQALAAGPLALYSGTNTPFAVELRVQGQSMAFGHPRPRIGYLQGSEVRWVDLSNATTGVERSDPGTLNITARSIDADGAEWTYRQMFRVDSPGAIATETSVRVDQDRMVVFLPLHMLIAGENSFGPGKGQGLFAGLEYLGDEPSRSEADIIGPEANRRVPASHKITFPLMAIQAGARYAGLIWEEPRTFSALFDSPDRTFQSGGHVMGVVFPGSDGANREEGSLLPYAGQMLKANEPLVSRAWFIGGPGRSVVPAVQHYVKLRGWPDLPDPGLNFSEYVTLAAQGWLESNCRETNLYRHAVWPGFHPQPAADAAVFQTWLAGHISDTPRAAALRAAATGALSLVQPRDYYHSAIGHVRTPVAPLIFGAIPEAAEAARRVALAQFHRFADDGSIPYQASAAGPDYGRTHFAPDANGLTAQVVATLLEAAAFSGDRDLIAQGIVTLRALDKFRDTVPRGAQTWEVPLHTPDILASAYLVRAYTLGFELTGEPDFLERALYWAWTGVPFVYLVNPTGQPVGPYGTIPVLGATNWRAPVWFGRPVQWCGLVYADALHRLAPHDPAGPWTKLADGITSAGLQHTWRADDRERVGLLADFYDLAAQSRDGPAINPATVGSSAARLYGQGSLYGFHAFRSSGLLVHAPGAIRAESENERGMTFTVRGWPKEPYFVLVNGLTRTPAVKVNSVQVTSEFHALNGQLILKLEGDSRVEIDW